MQNLPYSIDVVELLSPVVIVAISYLSESEENDEVKDEIRTCRLDDTSEPTGSAQSLGFFLN